MTEECVKLFKKHDPWVCCPSQPEGLINATEYYKCEDICKDNQDKCCLSDCIFEVSGVYVDGKYNVEKIQEAFEITFNDSMSDEKEKFTPIIKLSLEKCGNLSNVTHLMRQIDDP